jgi:hypothetical protein
MPGVEKVALPERRMLFATAQGGGRDGRRAPSLSVGHREVLEGAVDLVLSILEPAVDVTSRPAPIPRRLSGVSVCAERGVRVVCTSRCR